MVQFMGADLVTNCFHVWKRHLITANLDVEAILTPDTIRSTFFNLHSFPKLLRLGQCPKTNFHEFLEQDIQTGGRCMPFPSFNRQHRITECGLMPDIIHLKRKIITWKAATRNVSSSMYRLVSISSPFISSTSLFWKPTAVTTWYVLRILDLQYILG